MPHRIGRRGSTGEHERLGLAAFTGSNLLLATARSDRLVLTAELGIKCYADSRLD